MRAGGALHPGLRSPRPPEESEFYMVFTAPTPLLGEILLMLLETFDYMGWEGAQDGARGQFLRWFPPYSSQGL